MDDTALNSYLNVDYAKALTFFDERATAAKAWYRRLSVYLIVVSAVLTPIVAFAPDATSWRIIAAGLSASIVVATGLLAHLKCHENWLSYRASWDALERERRQYDTGTGDYNSAPDKAVLFVERVEGILAREGSDFYARHAKRDVQGKEPTDRK